MDANEINELIGIPFVSKGRDPKTGLDCWGLCSEGLKKYGYYVPKFVVDAYDIQLIEKHICIESKLWEEISEPEEPCVVVMRLGTANHVNHCALYIGDNQILNTREKTGSCLDRIDRPTIKATIRGYYRPPKEYKK